MSIIHYKFCYKEEINNLGNKFNYMTDRALKCLIKINKNEYRAIIALNKYKFAQESLKALIGTFLNFLNRTWASKFVNGCLKESNYIVFLDKKGRIVIEKDLIERLYQTLYLKEILYLNPIIRPTIHPALAKSIYELNNKIYLSLDEPNEKDTKLKELSYQLSKSDVELSRLVWISSRLSMEQFNMHFNYSHKASYEDLLKVKQGFGKIEGNRKSLYHLVNVREPLFREYEELCKDYLKNKYKEYEFMVPLINDIISSIIPFTSTIVFFIKKGISKLYNSAFGSKSLVKVQKNILKDIEKINLIKEKLFDISTPYDKIIT